MMNKYTLRNPQIYSFIVFFILSGLLFSNASQANTSQIAGTQLAFFVGYHSGGMHNANYNYRYYRPRAVYYSPRYHYRGAYKTPWTHVGHNCRKTCWLDRWTGRSLSCYTTC